MSENINIHTPASKLTIGGNIYEAGNAKEFKTGDWRSVKPIYLSEKCMMQFQLIKSKKEKTLTMTTAKVVEFVQESVLLKQLK